MIIFFKLNNLQYILFTIQKKYFFFIYIYYIWKKQIKNIIVIYVIIKRQDVVIGANI